MASGPPVSLESCPGHCDTVSASIRSTASFPLAKQVTIHSVLFLIYRTIASYYYGVVKLVQSRGVFFTSILVKDFSPMREHGSFRTHLVASHCLNLSLSKLIVQ